MTASGTEITGDIDGFPATRERASHKLEHV
jgi:hypothetical protein